ncbi:MAG: hypothetical protein WBS33_17455 [Verrucomicrobiia bacterium]
MESSFKLGFAAHVFGAFTHFQKRHTASTLDTVNLVIDSTRFTAKGEKPSVGTFHHCFPLVSAALVKKLPATKQDLPPARCEVYFSCTNPTPKTNGLRFSVLARPALQVVLQNKFVRSSEVLRIKQNQQGGKKNKL